jgi:hypothetical protein
MHWKTRRLQTRELAGVCSLLPQSDSLRLPSPAGKFGEYQRISLKIRDFAGRLMGLHDGAERWKKEFPEKTLGPPFLICDSL